MENVAAVYNISLASKNFLSWFHIFDSFMKICINICLLITHDVLTTDFYKQPNTSAKYCTFELLPRYRFIINADAYFRKSNDASKKVDTRDLSFLLFVLPDFLFARSKQARGECANSYKQSWKPDLFFSSEHDKAPWPLLTYFSTKPPFIYPS